VNHQSGRLVRVQEDAVRGQVAPRAIREFWRAMDRFWRGFAPALALMLALPLVAAAQGSAVRARITAQIDEGNLTTLRGNTHPLARPQFDQGAVADSQPIRRMLLLLQRSPEQETALRTLIDQQQVKSSPNFHRWLTPQQFGQQFGAAPADIQTVTNWLQSHGFQVSRVAAGGTLIEFSGTAGQVRGAFHTGIHRYAVNGQDRFANSSDPQIPAALSPVVAGLASLHNFPRKPLSRVAGAFQKDRSTGKITSVPSPSFTFANPPGCGANPVFMSACNAIGLGDFATIYNVGPLWSPGINGQVIDGSGQTIAIVGDSEICTASSPDFSSSCTSDDTSDFRSLFGLSTANLPTVILDGPDPGFNGDEIEGDLDVQWSGAVAKNAKIDFVIAETTEASAGTDLAAEYIVDNNLAPVLSESFGQCEAFLLAGGNLFESSLWEQAAAQGITVVVSAGDSGSAGCDDANTQTTAVNGANVNGIASTPFNVAAGGTDFDIAATNYPAAFWSTTNSTVNGIPNTSALSYIPEVPWNDSCARTGASGCTAPLSALLDIVGGGGGQSSCVAAVSDASGNITCPTASYTNPSIPGWNKPSYQPPATGSGLTVGNDVTRDIPDISLFAADGAVSNSFYIVCDSFITNGPCSLGSTILFAGVGGTSSSAPAFAGIMALVNQNMAVNHAQPPAQGQGNANYVLYSLYSSQQTASLSCNSSSAPNSQCTFYDVTKGNNSVPCAAGSPQCSSGIVETGTPAATASYIAGPGYDLATGLGSINVFNLVSHWPTEVGSFTPTTTTLCLSTTQGGCASSTSTSSVSSPITHGTKVFASIGVTSTAGAPPASALAKAEDVALIGTFPAGCTSSCTTQGVDRFDANTQNSNIYPLASGGTVSASATELVGGTYTVNARYGGDGKFGSSTSTPGVNITITQEPSTATVGVFSVNVANNTTVAQNPVPYGALNYVRVDVKGASGLETATGSVTLKDNSAPIVDPNGLPATLFALNTEGYAEDQTTFLSVGPHMFTAQYAVGDVSYAASPVSTVVPLTVSPGATTTTVTSSATSVAVNTPITLTAIVDTLSAANPSGGSLGASPSGTVTFKSGSTTLGSAPVAAVTSGDASGFDESNASLANVTLAATATITATYSGDANYSTSTTANGVTVTVGAPGINESSGCTAATITIATPGSSGTCLITVSGASGFAGTVALTAPVVGVHSGDVEPPSCSFGAPDQAFTAPNTITLSSTTTTGNATMTCTTTAVSGVMVRPSGRPSGRGWPLAGMAIALAGFLFLVTARRQRRWSLIPLSVLLAVVVLAGVSCSSGGSGGGTGGGNPGTTPDTYTVTVTATPNSGTAQTTTVSVVVQ
jgi:hypothetical protein